MSKMRFTAPDWPAMIATLEATFTLAQISSALGFASSYRVIQHYKRGSQPLYYRGERLIALWCATLDKTRADVPEVPVRKPYRVPQGIRKAEPTIVVPVFPVQPPTIIKRGPGRPKKVAA